jgi:glycerol-3-phosphate acyltransferase PlsY
LTGIVLSAAAAYALGCVPAAAVVDRLAPERRWTRAARWVVDFAKGLAAVALLAPGHPWGGALAATAVVAGHTWPMFGAGGRRPFAVAGGALTVVTPVVVPAFGLMWGAVYVVSGWVSAATVGATALLPVAVGALAGWPLGLLCAPVCVMVLERLRPSIRRLLLGTEPRHLWRGDS